MTEPVLTADIIGLTKAAPLSRRGFMTASAAAAAGYTLAAGPVRADVITTDTNGLDAGMAKVKVADGEMPAYFARPAGVKNPPVILVAMEIFGLHEYIKDVTRRLAKLGAFAVAPDYYFRKGDLTKVTEMSQLIPLVNSKPDAELFTDLDSTVAWAKAQGGDTGRLGIIGFCRGGRNVWEYAAHSTSLKAGVVFYGPTGGFAESAVAEEPDATRARYQRAGAWTLRRSGSRHPGGAGGGAESSARDREEDRRVQDLSRGAARLPCRLSFELPPRRRRGWLGAGRGMVQEVQGAWLIALP